MLKNQEEREDFRSVLKELVLSNVVGAERVSPYDVIHCIHGVEQVVDEIDRGQNTEDSPSPPKQPSLMTCDLLLLHLDALCRSSHMYESRARALIHAMVDDLDSRSMLQLLRVGLLLGLPVFPSVSNTPDIDQRLQHMLRASLRDMQTSPGVWDPNDNGSVLKRVLLRRRHDSVAGSNGLLQTELESIWGWQTEQTAPDIHILLPQAQSLGWDCYPSDGLHVQVPYTAYNLQWVVQNT